MAPPTDEALDVAWRALAEAGEDQPTEGWRTIPVERTAQCRILAGRRFPSGDEAVLFGFPPAAVAATASLPRARGFRVDVVRDGIPREALAWVALVREQAGSLTMFARMASDVIALLRGASADEVPLFRLFTGRIRAWQAFMESGREDLLSPAAEVGLVGELCFLRQILDAGVEASVAVDSWRGPTDGLHDFVLGTGAVEVKTSTASGEFPATIASLDQLDDSLVRPLFLAGVRLALRASGRTLSEIVADVHDCMAADLAARARFSDLVLRAGVLDDVRNPYVRRFATVRTMLFHVTDAFPRLTRRSVAQAVRRVRYDLDLDLVQVPETDLDRVLRELQVT